MGKSFSGILWNKEFVREVKIGQIFNSELKVGYLYHSYAFILQDFYQLINILYDIVYISSSNIFFCIRPAWPA